MEIATSILIVPTALAYLVFVAVVFRWLARRSARAAADRLPSGEHEVTLTFPVTVFVAIALLPILGVLLLGALRW